MVDDYLEKCAQVKVNIDLVESLLRPENLEVSLRYVLKHATGRGSHIVQLFDTSEKLNHFVASRRVASRRRWLESQGRDGARQENEQNEWHYLQYQGARAKAPPCPGNDWVYLCKSVFPFSKWPSWREVTMAKRFLKYFGRKKNLCMASWARCEAQWKGIVELERRCQDISREIQMLSKRQEILFKRAIEGKLRVQNRASERLQITEEIKEMEHTKTEEGSLAVGEEGA